MARAVADSPRRLHRTLNTLKRKTTDRLMARGQGGGMNMQDMFSKMMDMQKKMNAAQEELEDKTGTAEAGGGMVKVTANGAQKITGIEIDPEAIDPDDLELLEDLIIAGVNKALEDASDMAQEEMRESMGGMLPPGMDLGQLGF